MWSANKLLSMLKDKSTGTIGTIIKVQSSLHDDEERQRFQAFYLAFLTRVLEKVPVKPAGENNDNFLKRGTIAEIIVKSYEYAVKKRCSTPDKLKCPECGVDMVVTDIADSGVATVTCKCGHTEKQGEANG